MGVMADDIIWHIHQKEFGDMDTVPYIIHGKSYHIVSLKEPDYVMLMISTYGTLENLEGSDMQQIYNGLGG